MYGGDAKRAGEEFRAALRLHPHLSSAENGLHQTFADEGDHDGYLKLIRDQVQKELNNADAHTALVEELLERGNARCVRGRNDDAWGALGDLAVKGKDDTEAAAASPAHAEWHQKLAGVLEAGGESEQAAREYANAAALVYSTSAKQTREIDGEPP